MTQGDGMGEVTEADREKAREIVAALSPEKIYVDEFVIDGELPPLHEAIAAALAEEREKARAPFRALAQELATVACDHHASVAGDAYADAADRILAVLEGTYA